MWDTTITIVRDGTPLTGTDGRAANNLLVQVDQANDQETVAHQEITGHHVVVVYKIKTNGWWGTCLIKQDDMLIDNQFTDPDTNAAVRYQVTGRVRNYVLDHQEVYAETVPGTA